MGRIGIGKTRTKLATMLSEATGHHFSPEKLYPAQGYNRTNTSYLNDSFKWSAVPDDYSPMVDSYETMTECVKRGIEIVDGEVFAKPL